MGEEASDMSHSHPPEFPLLGTLTPGTTQPHAVALPGALLQGTTWPVTTVTGHEPGPVVFINAGVHGGEYPAVETVIRLGKSLNAAALRGTVVLMPVLNLPAFWKRSMFVCPEDGLNPNRVFPGKPDGTYSEQLVYALTTEFIARADAYIDLHGGDIPEDLVPFSLCRGGTDPVNERSKELAGVFGLPYLLTVNRPIQPGRGGSSFTAAAERGVPGFIAEAGGVGQLQQDAVQLLTDGVLRVLAHLEMLPTSAPAVPPPTLLTAFEWLYCTHAGMFYPTVAVNDTVEQGQEVGTIGSLFGETLETISSPVNGRVLFLTINPAVLEKGLLMGIGVAD
jgi:predicted deacylase